MNAKSVLYMCMWYGAEVDENMRYIYENAHPYTRRPHMCEADVSVNIGI